MTIYKLNEADSKRIICTCPNCSNQAVYGEHNGSAPFWYHCEEHVTKGVEYFITKHGLKFECKRVESRPDGLMGDQYPQSHFRCKVTKETERPFAMHTRIQPVAAPIRRSFSLYFSQGSAHTSDPTLADVLDCLAGDASGYENAFYTSADEDGKITFENWASEYGYDTDSRKAEKTFKAIKRQSEQMKRTLGAEAYEELLYNTERI